ncbi:hypothetical protein [Thermococcus sp. 21S7]|uniref:hypothetical protein n=1 Tax=Thermococcus sp. 21S7 TaxID=1638221 RepID=UPI001438A6AE|nr:hypothetical protein [Thermococcus sp. 21S7]NJE61194.1 hypothetical protein [Thermococcus sp. 21S7]
MDGKPSVDYTLEGSPYGVFQELLECCLFLLGLDEYTEEEVRKISSFAKEDAQYWGVSVKEDTIVFYTNLLISWMHFFFELDGDILKIHYYNDILAHTDCPEFKGRHRGVVEVPLKEFIEDAVSLAEEYLEKVFPLETEIVITKLKPESDFPNWKEKLKHKLNLIKEALYRPE